MPDAAQEAAISDNLQRIHQEEERIRAKALAFISKDSTLSDHLVLVHDAMEVLSATCRAPIDANKDELSVQLLGLRMFNGLAVGLKLPYLAFGLPLATVESVM